MDIPFICFFFSVYEPPKEYNFNDIILIILFASENFTFFAFLISFCLISEKLFPFQLKVYKNDSTICLQFQDFSRMQI